MYDFVAIGSTGTSLMLVGRRGLRLAGLRRRCRLLSSGNLRLDTRALSCVRVCARVCGRVCVCAGVRVCMCKLLEGETYAGEASAGGAGNEWREEGRCPVM